MIEINECSMETVENPDNYMIIQRPKGIPVSADEAKWMLRCIGVSEANINALNWDEYKED